MKISELHPDVELRNFLKNKISVDSSYVPIYNNGGVPSNTKDEDMIVLHFNGTPRSLTENMVTYDGYLYIAVYSKLNADGTIKVNRTTKILAQLEVLFKNLSTTNFFYTINLTNPITPTTANTSSGYSVTRLNIKWRTL